MTEKLLIDDIFTGFDIKRSSCCVISVKKLKILDIMEKRV